MRRGTKMMKRRDFLATSMSALAGAAVWRRNLLPAARIRFGCAAITWNGNDRQAIDDIAALGFHGIQLRQSAFDTWGDRPAELKDLLAQKSLVLVALSSGNVSLDPATEKDSLARPTLHARFVRDVGGRSRGGGAPPRRPFTISASQRPRRGTLCRDGAWACRLPRRVRGAGCGQFRRLGRGRAR